MAKVNGIRIQKVLSENGVMSRRKAEEAAGKDDSDPASLWKRPWDENGGDDPDKKDK